MIIERAEMSFLEIPFRMSVTHGARADRTFSDSLVLRLEADGTSGYGEAVVRDYVSGSLGIGEDFRGQAVRAGARIRRGAAGSRAFLARRACRAGCVPVQRLGASSPVRGGDRCPRPGLSGRRG